MSRNKRAKEDEGERVRDDVSGESWRMERKKKFRAGERERERERERSSRARSKIICRYNRLPAGKKVKCEKRDSLRFAPLWRCYVDGVSLLIFNPLAAYLVRAESGFPNLHHLRTTHPPSLRLILKCSWLRSEII
jgi:hypothetical protein